jgi:hypothetical protein
MITTRENGTTGSGVERVSVPLSLPQIPNGLGHHLDYKVNGANSKILLGFNTIMFLSKGPTDVLIYR